MKLNWYHRYYKSWIRDYKEYWFSIQTYSPKESINFGIDLDFEQKSYSIHLGICYIAVGVYNTNDFF